MNCVLCHRHFGDINELQRHVIKCSINTQIKCDSCGQTFTRKANLNRHIKLNRCKDVFHQTEKTKSEYEILEEKFEKRFNLIEEVTAKGLAELKEKPITNITNNQVLQLI